MWESLGGSAVHRGGVAALVVLMLAAACSTSSQPAESSFVVTEEPPPTTTDATTVATTATTTPTATTPATTTPTTTTAAGVEGPMLPEPVEDADSLTAPDAPAPEVDLRADTWTEFLQAFPELDAYWTWLHAHPTDDPDVLSVIFHPDGPAFETEAEGQRAVAERGWRLIADSAFGEIIGFGCCPDPEAQMESGRLPILIVSRAGSPPAYVVDSNGSLTEELPGWDRAEFRLVLHRSDDGRWRIWSTDF